MMDVVAAGTETTGMSPTMTQEDLLRPSDLAGLPVRKPRRTKSRARRQTRTALMFLAPWLIGVIVLQAYPILMTVYYAFTNFGGIAFPPNFIGFANFTTAFHYDPYFMTAVLNTLWWVGVSVPVTMVIGLLLALALNRKGRGMGVYRTLFYLPSMVPSVAAGLLFAWVFNPASGPVNAVLSLVHVSGPGWFTSPQWAKVGLLILSVWQVGPTMIIFLAGLQAVPTELLEAAKIDGATTSRRFRSVVLPLLTPTVFFNLILGFIGAFSMFTQALVVSAASGAGQTGSSVSIGAPDNSTLFYAVNMYRVIFDQLDFGYGSALSVLLTLTVALVAVVLFATARKWVFYLGGDPR
jgi:multiple sugar transport system permease protein